MFYMEAVVITVISVVAVIGGAIAALPADNGSEASTRAAGQALES